jgi:erythronate-4-phosphate dehydrogenase
VKVVVDAAVPWAREAFAGLGDVDLRPASSIDPAVVRDADALVVRTTTRVDARLLASSRVKFVGTATAGIDHVDVRWLGQRGIAFASAAGCNATAVAEYVLTALHVVALERDRELVLGPIGLVGFGQVGRRLAVRLRAIGAHVLVCDPPLAEAKQRGEAVAGPWPELVDAEPFVELPELLARSHVISLHVPLVDGGRHRTRHLIDAAALDPVRSGAVLVNTSRGSVIDEAALEAWLVDGGVAVLDVFADEPEVRESLITPKSGVRIATPHIAGYSVEGKMRGTTMIADALARHFGATQQKWDGSSVLGRRTPITAPRRRGSPLADCTAVLRGANPIEEIDLSLRALLDQPRSVRAGLFERLRAEYVLRRELDHFTLPAAGLAGPTRTTLSALGLHTPPVRAAIVLVAHGSPDPDWGRPLERLRDRLRALVPERRVELAYLDHLTPTLPALAGELAAAGIVDVLVASAFLSPGGNHIKRDIPALVQETARAHPELQLALAPGALGSEREAIEALARAALRIAQGS